ncbi:receptor-like protein kinase FERONIA [Fagus crenata]
MRNTDKFGPVSLPISIIFWLAFTIHVTLADNYVPTEKILLSCGGPPVTTDTDGRKWTTDVGSKYLSASGNSKISIAATQDPSVLEVPYMNARVFNSNFTYSVPVVAGRKFVRLYFYPASYAGLNPSDGVFSVTARPYTLLNNFSAVQTAEAINFAFLVKEYSINVDGATLDISFAPSAKVPKAYAFVNGIEIVSMPDIYNSSYSPTGEMLTIVGQNSPFTIDNTTALENVYRLNVGGNDISPSQDTGLYRSWSDDFAYLYGAALGVSYSADQSMKIQYPPGMPSYVAPQDVYATARSMGPNPQININYNLTWIFSVNSGFYYLVRLHFCEIQLNITQVNQRVFNIFLYNQTADPRVDVVAWALHENGGAGNGDGVPVYRDYLVLVPNGSPQQNLWLALHPDQSHLPNYYDAILNGIEIFKVNDTNGNLAGLNPIPAPKQDVIDPTRARTSSGDGKTKNQKAIVIGVVSGGIFFVLVIGLFLIATSCCRHGKDSSGRDVPCGWHQELGLGRGFTKNPCRRFSFAEINAATKNFDNNLLLGVGVLDRTLPEEQVSLAEWATHCHKIGILDQIIDPYLKGKIAPECFKWFAKIAMRCVADQGIDRPCMDEVLWNLEFSLQLQGSAEESGEGIGGMHIEEEPFVPHKWEKDPDASPTFDGHRGPFSREVTRQQLNGGLLSTWNF